MRSYLFAMMLAMLPAAIATAQFGANPQNPPGEPPPGVEQRKPAGQGAAGEVAAPPNAMFAVIDADGDGVITKAELRKAIKALRTLDADNDGNITLAEASAAGPAGPGGNPEVDRMMKELDKNGDGKLTADEVPPQMMPMLQGADKNGDRAIDRDELAAAMQQNPFRRGPGGFPPGANGRGADPRTGQFLKHDVNNDGRLTFEEIPRSMRGAFRPQDDLNGDGAIDPAELQAVIARLGGAARGVAAGAEPGGQRNPFRDPNRRNPDRADGEN